MQQDNNSNPNQAMVNKLFGSVFGNVEQHITTAQEEPTPTSQQPSPETSPVYLAKEPRGFKIDLIRVINVLYMLGFFTGKNGAKVTKKEVFTAIGKALNIDLSTYDSDLSRSLSDSTALEKHLSIFDRMKQKMVEVFNNYGGK